MEQKKSFLCIIVFMIFAAFGTILVSCGDDDTPDAMLEVSPQNLLLSDSGEGTLTITSNIKWDVSTTVDWLRFSTMSGVGNGQVIVQAISSDPNERMAIVSIAGKGFSKQIVVTQKQTKTPDQMLIGMWEASDGKGRTMKLSFRSDGVLTGLMYNSHENPSRGSSWDEPYEESFMGTYTLDTNTMMLSTNTPLDKYNDWGWTWKEYSKSVTITETTLNMDGYEYTKYSDTPTDLCEEALILGAWKQTTSNGYILFTFKADGTVIRHELNGSTWLPYEELNYSFDPTKNIGIGNELWYYDKDSSTNTELRFTHSWWNNEHITLSKTNEEELFLGGKSTLYERVSMLKYKTWTYVETYDGMSFKLTLEFNDGGAWYRYYENDQLVEGCKADYYYDYRNNGIYFKDWWTTGQIEDMFDYLEISDITENTLSIKDTDGSIITFNNRTWPY